MNKSLSTFERMLALPTKFEFYESEALTLHRQPAVMVSPAGSVLQMWSSEGRDVQMCYIMTPRGGQMMRTVAIASRRGVVPIHVAEMLTDVFMPDETVVVEYAPFRNGWPPVLIISNQIAVTMPGARRPFRE